MHEKFQLAGNVLIVIGTFVFIGAIVTAAFLGNFWLGCAMLGASCVLIGHCLTDD